MPISALTAILYCKSKVQSLIAQNRRFRFKLVEGWTNSPKNGATCSRREPVCTGLLDQVQCWTTVVVQLPWTSLHRPTWSSSMLNHGGGAVAVNQFAPAYLIKFNVEPRWCNVQSPWTSLHRPTWSSSMLNHGGATCSRREPVCTGLLDQVQCWTTVVVQLPWTSLQRPTWSSSMLNHGGGAVAVNQFAPAYLYAQYAHLR